MTPHQLTTILIRAAKLMKITRKELLALSGYPPSTVAGWVLNKKPISLIHYTDWAEALGYEVVIVRKGQKINVPADLV